MEDLYPAALPLRENLREAHARAWQAIAEPGEFWTAAERCALVTEARAAADCELCAARKDALSPTAVSGSHDATGALPDVLVELVHRLRTDPGRFTRRVLDEVLAADISEAQYVEAVSVVATSVIVDTLHFGLDLPLPELPDPAPGEPGGKLNPHAVDGGAWVPISAAAQDVSDTGLPTVPNIARAMGLVPSAAQLFFTAFRPHYALKDIPLSISQAQAEFVASRVSALNQCFY